MNAVRMGEACVVRYECVGCESLFDTEKEAEECCVGVVTGGEKLRA